MAIFNTSHKSSSADDYVDVQQQFESVIVRNNRNIPIALQFDAIAWRREKEEKKKSRVIKV